VDAAFTGILNLWVSFLFELNQIDFIFGYTLLEYIAATALIILVWKLVMALLGYASSTARSTVRGFKFHNKKSIGKSSNVKKEGA